MDVTTLVNNFVRVIVNPAILLLFAVALILFMWGLIEFLIDLNVNGKATSKGKNHMLYGIVGMFIMVAAYGIFGFINKTVCGINQSACIVK